MRLARAGMACYHAAQQDASCEVIMRARMHAGWQTRFGSFVASTTVNGLRQQLCSCGFDVTPHMIYSWVTGRRQPKLPVAAAIVDLSHGSVVLRDIIAQTCEARHGCRQDSLAE